MNSETSHRPAAVPASGLASRVLGVLAVSHFAWATILALAALWSIVAALSVVPYMSTGSIWSRLPAALIVAVTHASPPAALGAWMAILGRRLWRRSPGLRPGLLRTHGLLLVPGMLAAILGVKAMEAAARSSEQGGGLLSPLAAIPLILGIAILLMSLLSIVVALTVLGSEERASR